MAIPATDNDIITTTLIEWQPKLFDNITANNPFWHRLRKRGHIKHIPGGQYLEVDLMYAENPTFQWFRGEDKLNITKATTMQPAYFDWYLANENIIINGDEWARNKGSKTRKYSLLESRKTNAERSFTNKMAVATWQAVDLDDGKRMPGIPWLVEDTPSSKVGTIDRSQTENKWWRNIAINLTKDPYFITGSPTGPQMVQVISDTIRKITFNGERPTVIFTTAEWYGIYEEYLSTMKRFNTDEKADGSFKGLSFQGIDFLFDPNIKKGHMYILNEEYIKLNVHPDLDFKLDLSKKPIDQYLEIYPMYFMGGFTISNCMKQAVIFSPAPK